MVLLNSGINIYGYEYTNVYCFTYFLLKSVSNCWLLDRLNIAFFPQGAKLNSISCNEYVLNLNSLREVL